MMDRPLDMLLGPDEPAGGATSYLDMVKATEARYGLPPGVLPRLVAGESSYDPNIVNRKTGATGMGQMLPQTFASFPPQIGTTGGADITNPAQNIDSSGQYLRYLLDRYHNDLKKTLMGYYGGENQRGWGPQTQRYPSYVMNQSLPLKM